jgi:hypothetical protein
MVPGRSELSSTEGVNKTYYNAEAEGGPKNGVLTAIEDFCNLRPGQYEFFRFNGEAGLGVLMKKGGVKSSSLLAKWRRRCFLRNKYVELKNTVARTFPGGYRLIKRLAGKAPVR